MKQPAGPQGPARKIKKMFYTLAVKTVSIFKSLPASGWYTLEEKEGRGFHGPARLALEEYRDRLGLVQGYRVLDSDGVHRTASGFNSKTAALTAYASAARLW